METFRYDGCGNVANRLTECPACGHEFGEHEVRWGHFLQEHRPEDFGLSPLGEIPEGHDAPLFEPVEELPMPTEAADPAPERGAETIDTPKTDGGAVSHGGGGA